MEQNTVQRQFPSTVQETVEIQAKIINGFTQSLPQMGIQGSCGKKVYESLSELNIYKCTLQHAVVHESKQ